MNSNAKICLIYTGGTIGMHRDSHGVLRPPENPDSFLQLAPELEEIAAFDFIPLMNKDSTNMNPGDWMDIAQAIYDKREYGYNGFVIAHGTDTMHYSSSAVAFALGKNLNFPVVFTGAQTAPDVRYGDARVNLLRAFKIALTNIAEVVICFDDSVLRGCRAQKKDERRFDAFESPAYFPLAYITEDILITDLTKKRREKNDAKDIILKNEFASGIVQVSLIPGLESELLEYLLYEKRCNGVVLQSYGAGNVPNHGPYSWTNFIEKATERDKPILITSQFPANATLHTAYEPGRAAVEAGAIPTGNMTSACASAKFRWVLPQLDKMGLIGKKRLNELKKMMNTSYIGELDESNNKFK